MSLSVFYIVRNEQDRIAKSLESVSNVADEIVVVDTGSVDRTVEVCKVFGASIYKYKWDDSYSNVRNFALEKCTKDFVLYLDADETLTKESVEAIREVVGKNEKDTAYYVDIIDCDLDGNSGNLVPVKENVFKSPQIRLFSRSDSIKFKGRVRESVEECVYKSNKLTVKNSSANIMHHLYGGRGSDYGIKKEKYYRKVSEERTNINTDIDMKKESKKKPVKKCAIIVCVYNVIHATKKCIDSVIKNTKYPYQLILVDNGSTNNCSSYLKSVKNAKYIRIDENVGVAKSRNRAMRVAMKENAVGYICLLDNDTEVCDGWLTKMIARIDKGEADIVGPITNSAVGTQKVVKSNWVGRHSVEKIIDMVSKNKSKGTIVSTDFVNRFCQVFSVGVIRNIGFLDESFGDIGWEDNDFCRRALESGLNIAVDKEVFVYHIGHATSTFGGKNYFAEIQKSANNYHKKWKTETSGDHVHGFVKEEQAFKNPFTSIVVLTYNNLDINKRFFNALKAGTENYEVIVIDNGSTDGTVEYLENLSDITLIKNKKNIGIIKARNVGINMSKADYIVCLDNDQIVNKNWLVDLYDKMSEGYDFVGVEAWEVGPSYAPIKRHVVHKNNLKIDYVGAGGCLMKRSVLEHIGIYDERFGMAYFEDVDICFRAREAGYKIGWCSKKIINHLEHSTLIKGQKDFKYNDALRNSHRLFFQKVKDKKAGKKIEEVPITSIKKLVTFCMCLKNRSERALRSIESIVTPSNAAFFDFIIVEDEGKDNLNLASFKHKGLVQHYRVKTGERWTRGGLLNYGVKRARTEFVSFWDADFIFPDSFGSEYYKIVEEMNFDKEYLKVQVTETEQTLRKGSVVKKGTVWGGFYTYSVDKLRAIGSFDEKFVNWGYEDLDLNKRLEKKFGVKPRQISEEGFVYHSSHDDDIRNYHDEDLYTNKHLMEENEKNNVVVVNKKSGWGEFPRVLIRNKDWDKTVVIMGNGPSLKEVDFEYLRGYKTFGMNLAYRHWSKINWWPTYYGCFDNLVAEDHKEDLDRIMRDPSVTTEKFFTFIKISNSPKACPLHIVKYGVGEFSNSFKTFGYGGNTGVNCCQASVCMGYKKIVLVGIDCNYVQVVKGAKIYNDGAADRLVMAETPDKNPNYFMDDYNRKGDKYNIPNAHVFMLPAWNSFKKFAEQNGVEVVNCSRQSKLNCFRKSELTAELP